MKISDLLNTGMFQVLSGVGKGYIQHDIAKVDVSPSGSLLLYSNQAATKNEPYGRVQIMPSGTCESIEVVDTETWRASCGIWYLRSGSMLVPKGHTAWINWANPRTIVQEGVLQ